MISGGGWYFSSLFFSTFLHNKLFFFNSKLKQVFLKNNTLKHVNVWKMLCSSNSFTNTHMDVFNFIIYI